MNLNITPTDSLWLKEFLKKGSQPPIKLRVPLLVAGMQIGSVEEELALQLVSEGLLNVINNELHIDKLQATKQLNKIALWLFQQGLAAEWRDEQLPVIDSVGVEVATIERAVVRPLGITTWAVYLIGLSENGEFWMQRRSPQKAIDAGKLDLLVGGLVAAGESEKVALIRETQEEAGLNIKQLQREGKLSYGKKLLVQRPIDATINGYMVERCCCYLAEISDDIALNNEDGEVSEFIKFTSKELIERMIAGEVVFEACLILSKLLLAESK